MGQQALALNALTAIVVFAQQLTIAFTVKIHFPLVLTVNAAIVPQIVKSVALLLVLNVMMATYSIFKPMEFKNVNYARTDVLYAKTWLIVKSVTLDSFWTLQAKPAKSVHKTAGDAHNHRVASDVSLAVSSWIKIAQLQLNSALSWIKMVHVGSVSGDTIRQKTKNLALILLLLIKNKLSRWGAKWESSRKHKSVWLAIPLLRTVRIAAKLHVSDVWEVLFCRLID